MIKLTSYMLYLFSFVFTLFMDWLIRNNYFGSKIKFYYFCYIEKSFFFISFSLFIVIFLFLTSLNYFDISLFLISDGYHFYLYNYVLENNSSSSIPSIEEGSSSIDKSNNLNITSNSVTGEVKEGTVNINNPKLNMGMSTRGLNNLAAAASSTGGATLGYQIAKQIPGSPVVKLAAGLGVMGAVQASTAVMSKVLNSSNNDDNNSNITKNFIPIIFNDSNYKDLNDKFTNFPLNLLPEMNQLVNIEILFLFILLNIFIVNFFISFNYSKYLPNNKIGQILNFIISRHIRLWDKSRKILLIISWITLFICVIFSKFCLFYIIHY
jgi:hypothetical protein